MKTELIMEWKLSTGQILRGIYKGRDNNMYLLEELSTKTLVEIPGFCCSTVMILHEEDSSNGKKI
jgi:hypothetical protein